MIQKIDIAKLISGDRRTLSKAITLIESSKAEDQKKSQELLSSLSDLTKDKKLIKRIGVSGVPGVGKSTFIESLGIELIKKGLKVAVLAIDPSSPLSGGSILGDKTRMEKLSAKANAFIRPSPASGSLGGVTKKTRETILLCEAAGFDVILIETVGVGQSEYIVSEMVDLFTVLMLPNAGDEIQGIKKGILELVDILVVNKDDGENKIRAKLAKSTYENALNIISNSKDWRPSVLTCSSLESKNIEDFWNIVLSFFSKEREKEIIDKRNSQNKNWFSDLFSELIWQEVKSKGLDKIRERLEKEVELGNLTPDSAAKELFQKYKKQL